MSVHGYDTAGSWLRALLSYVCSRTKIYRKAFTDTASPIVWSQCRAFNLCWYVDRFSNALLPCPHTISSSDQRQVSEGLSNIRSRIFTRRLSYTGSGFYWTMACVRRPECIRVRTAWFGIVWVCTVRYGMVPQCTGLSSPIQKGILWYRIELFAYSTKLQCIIEYNCIIAMLWNTFMLTMHWLYGAFTAIGLGSMVLLWNPIVQYCLKCYFKF